MATILYLRSGVMGVPTYGAQLGLLNRGTTATSLTANTTAGGTWITIGYFISRPLLGFTLAQPISMNLRGLESNGQANTSLGVRIYKWTEGGGLGAQLLQISSATELATTQAARTASGTPTSTAFATGDMIVMEVGIVAAGGTMGGGRTTTLFYDGPTAAASGDSYLTFTDNFAIQRRIHHSG